MNKVEQIEKLLTQEFDAYIIVGSIYNPLTRETTMSTMRHGNGYAIEGMLSELACIDEYAEEEDDG